MVKDLPDFWMYKYRPAEQLSPFQAGWTVTVRFVFPTTGVLKAKVCDILYEKGVYLERIEICSTEGDYIGADFYWNVKDEPNWDVANYSVDGYSRIVFDLQPAVYLEPNTSVWVKVVGKYATGKEIRVTLTGFIYTGD